MVRPQRPVRTIGVSLHSLALAALHAYHHNSRPAVGERVTPFPRQASAESKALHAARALEPIWDGPAPRCVGARRAERLPPIREPRLQLDELAACRSRLCSKTSAELDG